MPSRGRKRFVSEGDGGLIKDSSYWWFESEGLWNDIKWLELIKVIILHDKNMERIFTLIVEALYLSFLHLPQIPRPTAAQDLVPPSVNIYKPEALILWSENWDPFYRVATCAAAVCKIHKIWAVKNMISNWPGFSNLFPKTFYFRNLGFRLLISGDILEPCKAEIWLKSAEHLYIISSIAIKATCL